MTTWSDAAGPITGDSNNGDFNGFNLRQWISTSAITNTGLTYVRVTFEASSAAAFAIQAAYIGHAAAAGDAYDFESTPTQLLFNSGSSGFSLSAGQSIVSDTLVFSITASKNLIVSFYCNAAANTRSKTTQANWVSYVKSGATEVSTANVTGYSTSGKAVNGVMRVEAGVDDAKGFFWFF